MSQKNYGKVDKFIHWLMAINIFATMIFSKGMSELPEEQKLLEYGDHGVSVTTILICLVFRIIWRATHGFVELPSAMDNLQKKLARGAHYLIYLLLIAQVSVGMMLASTTSQEFVAAGYNINYSAFDLVADHYYETLLSLHLTLYWVIAFVLAVHILAALKHHFIDKDDVLRSMLPGKGKRSKET